MKIERIDVHSVTWEKPAVITDKDIIAEQIQKMSNNEAIQITLDKPKNLRMTITMLQRKRHIEGKFTCVNLGKSMSWAVRRVLT